MKRTWTMVALLGAASLLPAWSAAAQTTAERDAAGPSAEGEADGGIQDIIVTAEKRQQSINKVGMAITAVTEDALREQQISSLADLAKAVPGLSFTNTGANTPVYTLRGVGFYDFSPASYPTVSVYVDQVALPFPILTSLTAFDLERVEVLKGPQGTLFGQNSTGGAINYIAAKPTADLTAGTEATIGRFGLLSNESFVSGPLAPDLNARLAVKATHSNGWQRSITRDDTLGAQRQLAGRLLLDWRAADNLAFELSVNLSRDHSDAQAIQFLPALYNPQVPPGVTPELLDAVTNVPGRNARDADWTSDNPMRYRRHFKQGALRADWDLTPDIALTSITSLIRFSQTGGSDLDGLALNNLDTVGIDNKIESVSQEVRIANASTSPFRFIVGANYSRDKVDYVETQANFYGTGAVFFDIQGGTENYAYQTMRNLAVFANLEQDIGSLVTLKAGARYTENRRRAEICNHDVGDGKLAALFTAFKAAFKGGPVTPLSVTDCIAFDANFDTGVFIDSINEDNVSWRAGIDLKPAPGLLVYANVSRGYKAGGYPNVNASATAQYAPVTQESILNYEAGFKAQLFDRRLGLNGTVFYMDYKDKQLRTKFVDAVFGILDKLVNVPESTIQGAEIEATSVPFDGLNLSATATYLDTRIDRYTGVDSFGQITDFRGTKVPYTPEWQLGASGRYEWAIGGDLSAFLGAQLNYRSATTAIIGEDPRYRIRGYTLVDLQAGIEGDGGKWRAMLWGKNVFNAYYWNNVVANYDTGGRLTGMPATYGVTFGYRF